VGSEGHISIKSNVNIGNPRVKGIAYQSYVRPVLEHTIIARLCGTHTAGSIKKIESVQRAARFTLGRYRRTVNAIANTS